MAIFVPKAADMALRFSRIFAPFRHRRRLGHSAVRPVGIVDRERIKPDLGKFAVRIARDGNHGLVPGIGKAHGLAGGRRVAALAVEIEEQAAQAVEDGLALVDLDPPQHMGTGAHHRVGAGIDRGMKQDRYEVRRPGIVGTGRLIGPMQGHGLERLGPLVHIARGLVGVNGEQHESGMGARRLHGIEDRTFVVLVHFPTRSRLIGEDLVAQPHLMRIAADIKRAADLAQGRKLLSRDAPHFAHMQWADADAGFGIDAEARHRRAGHRHGRKGGCGINQRHAALRRVAIGGRPRGIEPRTRAARRHARHRQPAQRGGQSFGAPIRGVIVGFRHHRDADGFEIAGEGRRLERIAAAILGRGRAGKRLEIEDGTFLVGKTKIGATEQGHHLGEAGIGLGRQRAIGPDHVAAGGKGESARHLGRQIRRKRKTG